MKPKYRHDLLTLLCRIRDPQAMDTVLQALLTARELDEVERRIQIFKCLAAQLPQREIAAQLGVGVATVTRGAHAYRRGKGQIVLDYLNQQAASTPVAPPTTEPSVSPHE